VFMKLQDNPFGMQLKFLIVSFLFVSKYKRIQKRNTLRSQISIRIMLYWNWKDGDGGK